VRLALLLIIGSAGLAHGSAADLFGLSAEESAVAGASTARVHDFSAGYYNPAALVRVGRAEASFGLLGYGSQLTANGAVHPISDPLGVVLGAAAPVPFVGALADRVFVAIALYVMPAGIIRVIAHAPDEPFFPYYDNRTQRLVVLPSLAVRLWGGLSAGLGINYLAGLAGNVAATEGATRAVEPRVDEAISAVARVNAGLLWRSPRDRVSVGVTFRQSFSAPFTTVTRNQVAGQPIDIDVAAEGLFTPHQFAFGGAFRAKPWLTLSLDGVVSLWSAWRGPYVAVASTLPLAGAFAASPPQLHFSDTVAVRAGAEATRPLAKNLDGALRLGYGFETSPIPADQPGVTNLLDGPKHFLAAGLGLALDARGARFRLDVQGQLQVMQPRTLTKVIAPAGTSPDPATALRDEVPDDPKKPETLGAQISNPGYPSITGSGFVWAAGVTLTVQR